MRNLSKTIVSEKVTLINKDLIWKFKIGDGLYLVVYARLSHLHSDFSYGQPAVSSHGCGNCQPQSLRLWPQFSLLTWELTGTNHHVKIYRHHRKVCKSYLFFLCKSNSIVI